MVKFSKTWWGQRFIEALERFTDSSRLSRGRSYAKNGRVKEYKIHQGHITAKVRGSVNPYFGVYKEPTYRVSIDIEPISEKDWTKALSYLGSRASMVSKLLLDEVPDNIDEAFAECNLHLLPSSQKDFETDCSCPDWENPCKHIAGVYYLVASELDRDPLLLFELRGITRDKLREKLAKTPLGSILSSSLEKEEIPLAPVTSYYSEPEKIEAGNPPNAKDFWHATHRFPQNLEPAKEATISAIVVKKGTDYPAFWNKDGSFIEIMEEIYQRVRTKNAGQL
ncbi:SWIM zinc finger family protein [Pannus brasiliensis CCIBt3594]|uniref:SWIM zinc finger family protein n=1 Tax=Pannus brasiliensis CCIBt3594 TaxID=1427578 RepID=A0AAW9QSS6_9CHRO